MLNFKLELDRELSSKLDLDRDITVYYYGGSGGQYFFHQLLLTGQYCCCFPTLRHLPWPEQLITVTTQQWIIPDTNKWKSHEIQPDNTWPHNLSSFAPFRVRIFCNPDPTTFVNDNCENVLLYTNIETQIKLSIYKQCWNSSLFESRPSVMSFIPVMPDYRGRKIWPEAAAFIMNNANKIKTVFLQDLLNDQKSVFGNEMNEAQQQLKQKWLGLHTDYLLRHCGFIS